MRGSLDLNPARVDERLDAMRDTDGVQHRVPRPKFAGLASYRRADPPYDNVDESSRERERACPRRIRPER